MIRKHTILKSITIAAACLALAFAATADDQKASPAGTWTWTTPGRNGGPDRTNTLVLKVDGEKLTGKYSAPGRNGTNILDIADGKITGETISFNVVREGNNGSITNAYSGKVAADTITGKMEFARPGADPVSRDWKATRSTDAKPADAK
jgi:hypothetical protein